MKTKASYAIESNSGRTLEKQSCNLVLDDLSITLTSDYSSPLYIKLRDVTRIDSKDYKIRLELFSTETIVIYDLGYKHDDFLRQCIKIRNGLILEDLLMKESLVKSGVKADVLVQKEQQEAQFLDCELNLYESAMVIFTKTSNPIRLLYCDIDNISSKNYQLIVELEHSTIIIKNLGKKYDSFKRSLFEVNNALSIRSQTILKSLLPKTSSLVIRQASQHMKDGKAVSHEQLNLISADLWFDIEKMLDTIQVKKEYEFLKSYSEENKICIGVKRGLMGDMTGEYLWFLFPIYSLDSSKPGNAIVMEAISTEGKSQASYCFKIVERSKYKDYDKIEDLHADVDAFIKTINRCMLEINFRREPIYLSDEKLQEERYQKYLTTMALIPELKILRDSFIGRIIHGSFEQWSEDVKSLLAFNVTTKSETDKWQK